MALKSFDDPNSTEARQHLLDRRCERLHPKRHRTIGRCRRLSAKKKARIAYETAKRLADHRRYKAKVRAYWRGEIENHP